jgi:anthranilate synthase/indole-3-glycerol phosphate synthase/phosphoribosylanthranilate isomerase
MADEPAKKKSKLWNITYKRIDDVAEAKKKTSVEQLKIQADALVKEMGEPLNLRDRIRASRPMAVAAEFKRASPSKGDMGIGLDATEQGLIYAGAGASVISILTEPKWFKGSLDDMLNVRRAVQSMGNRPAILRKDFLIDEYQIAEARAYGADTVLLIVAILEKAQLQSLVLSARSWGMEPLVEVNNEAELEMALEAGSKVIGVNNRNLHTFQVVFL